MRLKTPPLLLAAAMSLFAAGSAWADVNVSYLKPEEFTDVPRNATDRERLQKDNSSRTLSSMPNTWPSAKKSISSSGKSIAAST